MMGINKIFWQNNKGHLEKFIIFLQIFNAQCHSKSGSHCLGNKQLQVFIATNLTWKLLKFRIKVLEESDFSLGLKIRSRQFQN